MALCPNKSDCTACPNKVIWRNRRSAFKAADITGTHTLTLQEDTTYKAVHLPLALPIPFGIDDAAKGTITEATLDILDTMVLDGAFWAKCVLTYDTAGPDKLIRRTADGIGKIGNHLILPHLLVGQSLGHPLTCKVSSIGDDKEDKPKPAIDALASRILKITDLSAHSVVAPASVATSPGDFDVRDLDGIATSKSPIPCKPSMTGTSLPPKDTPLKDRLRDRA